MKKKKKKKLDKIQNEAARIATGTTKLVSIHALYSEIRWDTLQQRRNIHKLTLFYKVTHNLTLNIYHLLFPNLLVIFPVTTYVTRTILEPLTQEQVSITTHSYHQQLEAGTICLLKLTSTIH